jgi:hypothetical protein
MRFLSFFSLLLPPAQEMSRRMTVKTRKHLSTLLKGLLLAKESPDSVTEKEK